MKNICKEAWKWLLIFIAKENISHYRNNKFKILIKIITNKNVPGWRENKGWYNEFIKNYSGYLVVEGGNEYEIFYWHSKCRGY